MCFYFSLFVTECVYDVAFCVGAAPLRGKNRTTLNLHLFCFAFLSPYGSFHFLLSPFGGEAGKECNDDGVIVYSRVKRSAKHL